MKKLTEYASLTDFSDNFAEDLNNNKAFDPFLDWNTEKNVKSSIEKLEKFLSDDEASLSCVHRNNIILHSADEVSNLSRSDSDVAYYSVRDKSSKIQKRKYKLVKLGKKKRKNILRIKPKKEPLPMKMRALPKSFWEQPNIPNILSPGEVYPVMPIFPPFATHSKEVIIINDDNRPEGITTDANTDLLFSLFREVEAKQRKLDGQPTVTVIKRGRPKKNSVTVPKTILRDEDPCLISTVTDSILPLIPVEKVAPNSLEARIAEGEQVLARGLLTENEQTKRSRNLDGGNYSEILSDLVFQL